MVGRATGSSRTSSAACRARRRTTPPTGSRSSPTATNTLYVAQGGNTNAGRAVEQLRAAARVRAVGRDPVGRPRARSATRPTTCRRSTTRTRIGTAEPNDPFGGNDGPNQARLVAGGPVQVYSPGFRNPYDVLITEAGRHVHHRQRRQRRMGRGARRRGPRRDVHERSRTSPAPTDRDSAAPHHRRRATTADIPTRRAPTRRTRSAARPRVAHRRQPGRVRLPLSRRRNGTGNDRARSPRFPTSTNGLTEYTATNFGGAMKGDLVAAGFDNVIYRIGPTLADRGHDHARCSRTRASAAARSTSTRGGRRRSLPGHDLGRRPSSRAGRTSTCSSPTTSAAARRRATGADVALDEDGDGFDNADEIDNGTDPCSAADVPPDSDGDHVSDRNDADDDNDGIPDVQRPVRPRPATTASRPSCRSTYRGRTTARNPGACSSLGFTGLMARRPARTT